MSYNAAIPQPGDLISNSQPQILANFAVIDSSVYGFAREHVALTDTSLGGLHKLATMPNTASVAPATGYGSYYASKTGTTGALITEAVYKSGDATSISILSAVKAWGRFSATTIADGFNFASVTNASIGNYVVTLTNALASTSYGVLISIPMTSNFLTGGTYGYTIVSTTSFQINVRSLSAVAGAAAAPITFVVLQS